MNERAAAGDFFDAIVEAVTSRVLEILEPRLDSGPVASELLTVAEAAALIRSSSQRIYDLCSSGRLTRRKDGSRLLIDRAELLAYVASESCPRVAHRPQSQRFNGVSA